jgi:tRNA nucleotidyltransferase (CCA-adding enzyme)
MTEAFTFFEVGGCVRDSLLGLSSKDVDFSVVAQEGLFQDAASAFAALEASLTEQGFKVFESRPEFLTIRAQVAPGHPLQARTKVADFVLARKDGPYSDGRRPDWVLPGTLHDDLGRRDFTSGAIAKCVDGTLIDPFNGVQDIQDRKLRFVGNAQERVAEDGLRVLRGLRFEITKGFKMDDEAWQVCVSPFGAEMLSKVSAERVREELNKMFRADTMASLSTLCSLPLWTREAIFRDGLRLDATFAH